MRVFAILCWLMIPVLAYAYHLGPGQERMKLDDAQALLNQASLSIESKSFEQAREQLSGALAELPEELQSESYSVRLELAKAQMNDKKLPEARAALGTLLSEMENDPTANKELTEKVRAALANSQYYMTWLMRLEGLPAADWEPEIEAARQNYRLLAEDAEQASNGSKGPQKVLTSTRSDLEAAIRLARMDLTELQGLKIPSQCNGCCSSQCKKPNLNPKKKKGEKPGKGANLGPLPDGSGS